MRKRKRTGTSSSDFRKTHFRPCDRDGTHRSCPSLEADLLCHCQLEAILKSNLLQMKAAPPDERFQRTVETVEASVSITIQAVANEDGSDRLCVVNLPNPGPHGGICRAYLAPDHVDMLIAALTVWKVLP